MGWNVVLAGGVTLAAAELGLAVVLATRPRTPDWPDLTPLVPCGLLMAAIWCWRRRADRAVATFVNRGRPAEATIVAIRAAPWAVAENGTLRLELAVGTEGETSYSTWTVTGPPAEVASALRPGARVPVLVDPDRRERVIVDWARVRDGSVDRATALAALSRWPQPTASPAAWWLAAAGVLLSGPTLIAGTLAVMGRTAQHLMVLIAQATAIVGPALILAGLAALAPTVDRARDEEAERLQRRGSRRQAVVGTCRRPVWYGRHAETRQIQLTVDGTATPIKLTVTPPYHLATLITPGRNVPVRVDPASPQRVAIDWAALAADTSVAVG